MPSFMERARSAFNGDLTKVRTSYQTGSSTNYARFDTTQMVMAPILSRIAIDAANIPIKHVMVDEEGNFKENKISELNDRLTIMANIDQTGKAFIQDAIMTMLGDGVCAIVPVEISSHPLESYYDMLSIRVGAIRQWYNYAVEVDIYNELTGQHVQKVLPKSYLAIPYNPFYSIMNEPNSTLKRLVDKLALLDVADRQLYAGKLDLILQLPYTLKNERRREEAGRRLADLEAQLYNREYGVGYVDATERVVQLNRPVTNTLFDTVTGLTQSLYSQLGLTPNVFNGTATQEEMLSYNNRTVLPVLRAILEAMTGAFFSRTAIRQGNAILAFPDLFKMAPLEVFAEAADKFTRNAIVTSNEIRSAVGLKPSSDPDADALRNKNLNLSDNKTDQEEKKEPTNDNIDKELN